MAEKVLRERQSRARSALRTCLEVLPQDERKELRKALEESGTAEAWSVMGGYLSRLRENEEEVPEELQAAESRFSRYQNDAKPSKL